jgi:Ca2+-binding EF-hand superfamily protein
LWEGSSVRLTPLRLALLFGAALFVLGPATGLTQQDPRADRKSKKGGDGSAPDAGGGPGGMKGKWGGQDAGGGPGGMKGKWGAQDGSGGPGMGNPGGGPGGRQFDPNMIFNMMSGGQDVIVIANVQSRDPNAKENMTNWATAHGISNGQLTRDQFAQYMQERMAQRGQGNGPGGQWGQNRNLDADAEDQFKRLDRNGDGVLTTDEMNQSLLAEWQKWDKNGDGQIDLAEYKEYYKARMEARMGNRQGQNNILVDGNGQDLGQDDDKRPTVYKVGHLPKELPPWFEQMDSDKDGQVGLYEWKKAGGDLHLFAEMDRNGDGFLTVEEVLRYQKMMAHKKKEVDGSPKVTYDEDGNEIETPADQTPTMATWGNRMNLGAWNQNGGGQWGNGGNRGGPGGNRGGPGGQFQMPGGGQFQMPGGGQFPGRGQGGQGGNNGQFPGRGQGRGQPQGQE